MHKVFLLRGQVVGKLLGFYDRLAIVIAACLESRIDDYSQGRQRQQDGQPNQLLAYGQV